MIEDRPDGTRIVRRPDGSEAHFKPYPHGEGKRLDRHFNARGELEQRDERTMAAEFEERPGDPQVTMATVER